MKTDHMHTHTHTPLTNILKRAADVLGDLTEVKGPTRSAGATAKEAARLAAVTVLL